MIDMILTDKYGYYHATNEGEAYRWYDFTKEIFRQAVELGHTEYAEDKVTVLPLPPLNTEFPRQHAHLTAVWTKRSW